MNSPIIISVIASVATIAIYVLAGRSSNKWIKGLIQVASVIAGIFIAGAISADNAISAKSGEYFFYIMICVAILSKVFGRKKSEANA